MHTTIFCTFNRTVGWRVHEVVNVETNCISIVIRNGIKMLAIPIIGAIRKGQFCNPAKLLMKVVRETKQAVTFVNDTVTSEPYKLMLYYAPPRTGKTVLKSHTAMLH